jgi:hypothetical protein
VLAEAKHSQLSTWQLLGFLLVVAPSCKKYAKKKKTTKIFSKPKDLPPLLHDVVSGDILCLHVVICVCTICKFCAFGLYAVTYSSSTQLPDQSPYTPARQHLSQNWNFSSLCGIMQ